jgi:quinol monooxygenase YgiN
MARVWTHGTWIVKSGQEGAFVQAWSELARQVVKELRGEQPTLLRDRDKPNVFKTFGAWPDIEAVEEFRASDTFRSVVAELQPILESFEPMTLDEVDWK